MLIRKPDEGLFHLVIFEICYSIYVISKPSTARSIKITPRGFWLMKPRCGPLYVDEFQRRIPFGGCMLMNYRGGPPFRGLYVDELQKRTPFGGCMLINSRGRPNFGGLYVNEFQRRTPFLWLYVDKFQRQTSHLEKGSAFRDNFYGSSSPPKRGSDSRIHQHTAPPKGTAS